MIHIPNLPWIIRYKVFKNHLQWSYLKGSAKQDGFKWHTRGLPDAFMSYDGQHETWLKPEIWGGGKLFVDIGAHVGAWSLRASKWYEQVIAFEPSNSTRKVLMKNISVNHVSNVKVFPYAIGESVKKGVMYHFSWLNAGNSLLEKHPILAGKPTTANSVQVLPLDYFCLSPDLLKVDTEGYELQVLAGAQETLLRSRKVIVEHHRQGDIPEIEAALKQAGFKTRIINHPKETHVVGERSREQLP